MSKETAPTPDDFDLFATPVDTHLAEELAKGTFQWTNKYTKIFGVLTIMISLLSVGAWYGHHSATASTANTGASLRSSFARLASSGGFGGAGGGSSSFGGGGGFGVRITGTIAKISGGTVTITLSDPTQAASLKAGDTARISDTAGIAAGGFASGSSASGAPAGAPAVSPGGTRTRAGGKRAGTTGTTSTTPSGAGVTGAGGTPSGAGSAPGSGGRTGGPFSNPAFTACLTKAGVTITPGQRPNFQDPTTAAALQGCMKSLGITFGGGGGGFGGGAGGGGFGGGAGAGAGASTTTP